MTKGQRALNLFLMLAALRLALVTGYTLAARLWLAFDLFSHFRLQYVVAALMLGAAALALRAHPSAVVALGHGWAIEDLWLGGSARAAPGGVPVHGVSSCRPPAAGPVIAADQRRVENGPAAMQASENP